MKELSLNILDIAENSVKAEATLTEIYIKEDISTLTLEIRDNGYGMSEETVRTVTDPFYTTRTTRSVGLGIPLLKLACEQTGGNLTITSKQKTNFSCDHGTSIVALFHKNHLDFTPLGDVISTIVTLIQGHPDTDFLFIHTTESTEVRLDTRELREVLIDVPLSSYEVLSWIREYLNEQYNITN